MLIFQSNLFIMVVMNLIRKLGVAETNQLKANSVNLTWDEIGRQEQN